MDKYAVVYNNGTYYALEIGAVGMTEFRVRPVNVVNAVDGENSSIASGELILFISTTVLESHTVSDPQAPRRGTIAQNIEYFATEKLMYAALAKSLEDEATTKESVAAVLREDAKVIKETKAV